MANFDMRLPNFRKMNTNQDIYLLNDYFYQLIEALKTTLNNIGAENIDPNLYQKFGIKIDDELSYTSTNPVQNRVITGEIGSIKAVLDKINGEVI